LLVIAAAQSGQLDRDLECLGAELHERVISSQRRVGQGHGVDVASETVGTSYFRRYGVCARALKVFPYDDERSSGSAVPTPSHWQPIIVETDRRPGWAGTSVL
jgi:hypothetical protein